MLHIEGAVRGPSTSSGALRIENADGFYLVVNDKVKRTNNYHFNEWVFGMKFIVFNSDGINPLKILKSTGGRFFCHHI